MSTKTLHVVGSKPSLDDVDPSDFAQVFRRFAPYVARIGWRILGSGDDVDDLVQDVFLDAHSGLAKLRDPRAMRGWLATVTVRKARRRLGRQKLMRFIGLDAVTDTSAFVDRTASAESRAWIVAVYGILDGVSPEARIAWVMHRVEGESLEAVAEMCGCSRATAHRRLTEAQGALERGLHDVADR